MTEFRIEKDSMGEMQVEKNAYYGAQTQRAVKNFTISSDPMPWDFLSAVLQIKYCAAKANGELNLLSPDMVNAICTAIDQILSEKPLHQFPVPILQTGSGTSTNMNVNEVIAGIVRASDVEISPNDHVNLGQSSNDVIPTAIKIASAQITIDKLIPSFQLLAKDIRKLATNNKSVIKTGKTHLMDALPILLSDELEAWALQLDECNERFSEILKRLVQVPLGGTAVGSGINCHPDFAGIVFQHLHSRIGLSFQASTSSFKDQSSLDTLVEFSGNLKTGAVVLSKIANDLRWMNSGPLSGLNEVQLPPLQPGSSIMPAKINPIIPEAVLMAMAQVIGNDATISLAGLGGSFQLNTMLPVTAAKLIESVYLLSNSCLSLGEKCFHSLKIVTATLERSLSLNPILVTSLSPLIGYDKAAELGKIAQNEQRPILEVALEHTNIAPEHLQRLLNPAYLAQGNRKASS